MAIGLCEVGELKNKTIIIRFNIFYPYHLWNNLFWSVSHFVWKPLQNENDLEMNVTVMTLITIVTVETVVTPPLLYTFSFLPSIINQKPEALSKLVACFT